MQQRERKSQVKDKNKKKERDWEETSNCYYTKMRVTQKMEARCP